MPQPTASSQIETTLQREITGQLVVGRYLLSVGSLHGALLGLASEDRPTIASRQTPVIQVPRAISGLLGRQAEIDSVIAALQSQQIIEIYGPAGIGKTALLRYLAHHLQITTSHPDGILYYSQGLPGSDRLQSLFDAFYHGHPEFKPFDTEIQEALQDKQILVLLDDDSCGESVANRTLAEEIQPLIAALPKSTFLIASQVRHFGGETGAIALKGLAWLDSLALMERELGRSLKPEHVETANTLWQLLKGHPQRLLQAAALVHSDQLSLVQVLERIQAETPERSLTKLILASLPKTQRWIIAVLVAMGEVGLMTEQIAAITGPPNPQASLQALLHRHLIQLEGYRHRLSSSLLEILQEDFNKTPWMERVLAYLIPWAEQHQLLPEALLTEREMMLYALRWTIATERWTEALQLIRALERALFISKQWETCRRVLHLGLQAAWALEDSAAEAWVLHQLGTLASCQENVTTAYDALSQALTLRSMLGDETGASVTHHNREQLKKVALPARRKSLSRPGTSAGVYAALGVIGLTVFLLAGWVGLSIFERFEQPSNSPTLPIEGN